MITISFDLTDDARMKIVHASHKVDMILTMSASIAVFDVLEALMEDPDNFEISEKAKAHYRKLAEERSRRERAV